MLTYGKQSINQDDIDAVVKALKSDWLTQGPMVAKFEKDICEYTGAKYCVAVANGTAALHLAVLALELSPGFELITSPLTFAASANCAHYAGGRAVFADINFDTGLIDPKEIEKRVTPQTKVIIPVHYAGQSTDMKAIKALADKHNLKIIEDAAHAIGSEYADTKVGSCKYSDMTIFSFHPVKTITTGEGGAITTNDRQLYEKLLLLRTHGITKDSDKFLQIGHADEPWYYEMQTLGFNYRLTDIQAALGVSQLKRLDSFLQKRRSIVDTYNQAFADIPNLTILKEQKYSRAAFHLYPLLIDFESLEISKIEFFEQMKLKGISLQVHYIPVHLQPFYQQFGYKVGDFPQAEKFYEMEVSLPLYPNLRLKDVDCVIPSVKELLS